MHGIYSLRISEPDLLKRLEHSDLSFSAAFSQYEIQFPQNGKIKKKIVPFQNENFVPFSYLSPSQSMFLKAALQNISFVKNKKKNVFSLILLSLKFFSKKN